MNFFRSIVGIRFFELLSIFHDFFSKFQPHSRSHSQPRYHATARPNEMYEYMPSSMMRPGSRVGIAADPAGSTEIADYDVIQRLQNTHVQPQQQPPPPPPSRPAPSAGIFFKYSCSWIFQICSEFRVIV